MIQVKETSISEADQKAIRDWLDSPARFLFAECVKGEIAALTAQAMNLSMSKAVGVIQHNDIHPESKDMMKGAAVLQLILIGLDEQAKKEFFKTVTLEVQ